MNNPNLLKNLVSLVQLDIDAVHAYEKAIEKIEIGEVKETLIRFKEDHVRHIADLSPLIRDNGGEPPEFKPDFKGLLIQGFTALRSSTGTEGALKAMKMNEKLTNSTYEKALSWELPEDVRRVVQRNRADEETHLRYVERVIERKIWEQGRTAA
jgi:uncharacterized protein (TIGR02284 family)